MDVIVARAHVEAGQLIFWILIQLRGLATLHLSQCDAVVAVIVLPPSQTINSCGADNVARFEKYKHFSNKRHPQVTELAQYT